MPSIPVFVVHVRPFFHFFGCAQLFCTTSAGLIIFTTAINIILLLRIYALYKSDIRGAPFRGKMYRIEHSFAFSIVASRYCRLRYASHWFILLRALTTIPNTYSRVCGESPSFR